MVVHYLYSPTTILYQSLLGLFVFHPTCNNTITNISYQHQIINHDVSDTKKILYFKNNKNTSISSSSSFSQACGTGF